MLLLLTVLVTVVPTSANLPANLQAMKDASEAEPSESGASNGTQRSGGLVVMVVFHKSGMFLAPRLINRMQKAGLAKVERRVKGDFGNYQKCARTGFCYGWRRQEENKIPQMECPTYSDYVRNGLRAETNEDTPFMYHMTNGAFVCPDMAANFKGPLPRVAQMLRDPFRLVVSSYIYHSQVPTPEDWVINSFKTPCVPTDEQTATGMAFMAEQLQIPLAALVDAARLHKQLFDKGGNPYYTSLTSLSRAEGVRLEASRYLMFMPAQRKPEVQACGDGLLVMAAGAVAVRRQFEGEVFLMEDWIGNRTAIRHAMGRLLNLVCGDGECKDPRVVKRVTDEFITLQQRDLGKTEGGNIDTLAHVTHLEHGKAERHTLEKALKADTVLGPILDHLRCIITRGGMPGEECCYGHPDASC